MEHQKRGSEEPPAYTLLACYVPCGVAVALSFFAVPAVLLLALAATSIVAAGFLVANFGWRPNAVGCILIMLTLVGLHIQRSDRGNEPLIQLRSW